MLAGFAPVRFIVGASLRVGSSARVKQICAGYEQNVHKTIRPQFSCEEIDNLVVRILEHGSVHMVRRICIHDTYRDPIQELITQSGGFAGVAGRFRTRHAAPVLPEPNRVLILYTQL